jgi:non-lysosomal glucosylceramidase
MNRLRFITVLLIVFAACCMGKDPESSARGKKYIGQTLQNLRVPVGGIGTGDILMGGRGNIEFMEIFNRPNRVRRLEKTFFALWLQADGKESVTKLLEREQFPPFHETTHQYAGGLPRLREAEFRNAFPIHSWQFRDEDIPMELNLEVFSPFIPLNVKDSSFPLVAFYWMLRNKTAAPVRGTLMFAMENPIMGKSIVSRAFNKSPLRGVQFEALEADNINYHGCLTVATPAEEVTVQTHWLPGEWRDETHLFWDDFSADGRVESRLTEWEASYKPTSYNQGTGRMASILVHFNLKPGQEIRIPFYMAWYFPFRVFQAPEVFGVEAAADRPFKNAYSALYTSDGDVLKQFRIREKELRQTSAQFSELLTCSAYPESVLEALRTQASTLRTHLIQVTAEGEVHGFEGVGDAGWCCPGTCTHVWNYEQTLASLFPSLERKMREIEFLHNTFDNGFQAFRSIVPLGDYWFDGPAAADGQMGAIVRVYREWKLSGDNDWLARLWPKIRKSLEFAWTGPGKVKEDRFKHQEKQTAWDPEKTGFLTGLQHNTYDINFYGPSSMTTSLYLAALKACSEMAEAMGEKDLADEYLKVYRRGVKKTEKELWNGSYFIQIIEEAPESAGADSGPDKMPKYQYGNGCLADQLLGQYLAFVSGMGYILDETKVSSALKSVFDYNFINPLRQFANVQRVYGLNDEAGVVLCSWPRNDRPALPFVYSDEIWTGVEYQAAASLIYAGFVQEGLDIVKAVQERHDGYRRNPFEHNESGVHYARAMASWSVLLALSGIQYDGVEKTLSFDPKLDQNGFATFWSTDTAWGKFSIEGHTARLRIDYGALELKQFRVQGKDSISFKPAGKFRAGDEITLEWK